MSKTVSIPNYDYNGALTPIAQAAKNAGATFVLNTSDSTLVDVTFAQAADADAFNTAINAAKGAAPATPAAPVSTPIATINDAVKSTSSTYSSTKIETLVASGTGSGGSSINDAAQSTTSTYSSSKVASLIAAVPTGASINDGSKSASTTYSSNKIEALVAAVPASTPAVSNTTFNVLSYGAVADSNGTTGSGTDNTTAFQNAIAAAQVKGGTVSVPAGTYRLTTASLAVTASNVMIEGAGKLFFDSADITSFGRVLFDGGVTSGEISNVGIKNVTVFNRTGISVAGSEPGYNGCACLVTFRGCANFIADGVDAYNSPNYVFSVLRSRDGVIRRCYGHDSTADGAHVQDGSVRVAITDNSFINLGDDGVGIGYWGAANKDIIVRGNRFSTIGACGIAIYAPTDGVIVSGNTVETTYNSGVKIAPASKLGGSSNAISGVKVHGNHVRSAGMLATNVLARGDGLAVGIHVASSLGTISDLEVTSNTVRNTRNSFFVTETGGSVANLIVSNNAFATISATGGQGATTSKNPDGSTATGNSRDTPDTIHPGMSITSNVAFANVVGNVVTGAVGSPIANSAQVAITRDNAIPASVHVHMSGDSIGVGVKAVNQQNAWFYAKDKIIANTSFTTSCVSGKTQTANYNDRATLDIPTIAAGVTNIAIIQGVENDLNGVAGGTSDPSALYTNVTTPYIAALKAAGFQKVLVCTALPETVVDKSANISTYNTAVKNNAGSADGIVDFAADATMGASTAPNDATLYADKQHPTSYGYSILGPILAVAINKAIAGVTATAAASTPIATDTFTRADVTPAAGALGVTTTGSKTWGGGSAGIVGGKAYFSQGNNYQAASIDSGLADVDVSVDITPSSPGRVVARGADATLAASLTAIMSTTSITTLYYDGTTAYYLNGGANGAVAGTYTAGTTYTLRMTVKGNVVTVYVNGTQVQTGQPKTAANGTIYTMPTGTFVGFQDGGGTGGTVRYDNFTVSAAS